MSTSGYNHFPQIAAQLKPAFQKGVKNTAKAMRQNMVGGAPFKTGFMSGNVYVSTWDESTYGQGPAPMKKGSSLLPEVKSGDDLTAIVGAGANYSVFVELGTRYMSAQPWFYPGVDQTRGTFATEMALALKEATTV